MELFLIALSLSMDAFAVSMCRGLCMKILRYSHGLIIAMFFGLFQAVMPLIGWALGKQFEQFILPVGHWIAFALLAYIGGNMLWEAFHEKKEEEKACAVDQRMNYKELLLLSLATSIDALVVGVTFAFLQKPILPSVLVIGFTTFVLSFLGVMLGHQFGTKYKKNSEILGGLVLLLIGLKILLEHLGILTFEFL